MMRVRENAETRPPGPSMPLASAPILEALEAEAKAAEAAELSYRNEVAKEIAERERRRQFAYRRLDLADTTVKVVRAAETEEAGLAAGLAAFKRSLGWNTETEVRKKILAAWTPVVAAVWRTCRGEAETEQVKAAIAAIRSFEAWYLAEHGKDFLALFDVELPELPVVEF